MSARLTAPLYASIGSAGIRRSTTLRAGFYGRANQSGEPLVVVPEGERHRQGRPQMHFSLRAGGSSVLVLLAALAVAGGALAASTTATVNAASSTALGVPI